MKENNIKMPRKMCIMHKFLGIMIKDAHHKGHHFARPRGQAKCSRDPRERCYSDIGV